MRYGAYFSIHLLSTALYIDRSASIAERYRHKHGHELGQKSIGDFVFVRSTRKILSLLYLPRGLGRHDTSQKYM